MVTPKPKQAPPQDSQLGFTIIESLVAIVVVSILLAAIAPPIILSVATRLQAKRIEVATRAAKTYIDGVRTKAIAEPPYPSNAIDRTTSQYFLESVPVPTSPGTLNCATGSYCTVGAANTPLVYCVDGDGDSKCTSASTLDMTVEPFRSALSATSTEATRGYRLGVRVYRADAFKDTVALTRNTSTARTTQATFTGGLGSRKAPLLEVTTEISDPTTTTFQNFCDRLGGCQ